MNDKILSCVDRATKPARYTGGEYNSIVKENCETPLGNSNPNDDLMEKLLG